MEITVCRNCGKEFKRAVKGKHKKNYMYCSTNCYWEYHLRDIIKVGNKAKRGEKDERNKEIKNRVR